MNLSQSPHLVTSLSPVLKYRVTGDMEQRTSAIPTLNHSPQIVLNNRDSLQSVHSDEPCLVGPQNTRPTTSPFSSSTYLTEKLCVCRPGDRFTELCE